MTGKVYLVGAGPGDPALITLRGQQCLAAADLVLYDALAHPDLLALAPNSAERTYVGKRAGRASERQAAINARMVEAAQAGKVVVRLKGGDPFLFGRGSEEAEVLAAEGIPFEVVPGVPSPLAATSYAGISLTHRTYASSVAYLTATESAEKDRTQHDWTKLATATQTLVIFMGMRKLDSLMRLLMDHGRDPTTPVAVVQWASLPTQRTVVATVETIAEQAQGLGLPSLIIVGEVVRLRETLRWFDRRPLFGRTVLVTRAQHQASVLADCIRGFGGQPRVAPTIVLSPPEDRAPLENAARSVGSYDWVLFTSRNAVDAFVEALYTTDGDARRFGSARICAIGAKTSDALRSHGLRADLVPEKGHAEGVLASLTPRLDAGSSVLLPRAEKAREVVPTTLRSLGHRVDVVTAYRNLPPDEAGRRAVREGLAASDAVTFTSSSTVRHLCEIAGVDALQNKLLASIGPATSATLREFGLPVTVETPVPTVEALVAALATHYGEAE